MDKQNTPKCDGVFFSLKKEYATYATTWVNLVDIMLIEISQSEKDTFYIISLTWGTQNSQIHRDRK